MLFGIFVVFIRKFECIFYTPFPGCIFFKGYMGTEVMVGIAIHLSMCYCRSIIEFNLCLKRIRHIISAL